MAFEEIILEQPLVELRQSFPSRVQAISRFIDQLMPFIRRFRNSDDGGLDVEIALREALANAVVHGNQENPDKRVYVTTRCGADGELLVTIRDEGQGFDSLAVPDPTTRENILFPCGRGIYLMHALMDEVCFERHGAVVTMHRKAGVASNAPSKSDQGTGESTNQHRETASSATTQRSTV